MEREPAQLPDRYIGYPVIDISTPREDLLCLEKGEDRQSVIQRALEDNITYIPVSENGRITRLTTRDNLESDEVEIDGFLTADWVLASGTPILTVVKLFAQQPDRIFLVLHENEIAGLVAPADLNKAAARASIYLLLAEFEVMLGKLIRVVLSDEDAYSRHLTKKRLTKLRDEAKAVAHENLDLTLIDSMYITDLVEIARKDEQLRELLSFRTATEAKRAMNIKKVRDAVSHPVGPLISSRGELKALHEACERLFDLNKRVSEAHTRLSAAAANRG